MNKKIYCSICQKEVIHKSLNGVIVHEREDCPPDIIYFITESSFELKP